MTRTAWGRRMTQEEFDEMTRGMTPEEREEMRVEVAIDPLFDMFIRFEKAFARCAIDRLDVSDADAERMAQQMEGISSSGAAFAHLLRHIKVERALRQLAHMTHAIWLSEGGEPRALSLSEVPELYAKLNKGDT